MVFNRDAAFADKADIATIGRIVPLTQIGPLLARPLFSCYGTFFFCPNFSISLTCWHSAVAIDDQIVGSITCITTTHSRDRWLRLSRLASVRTPAGGGPEVICLDNFFTGARRNVEHLLDHKRFELIRHDVTFPIYLEIDQIYNLACPASPIHYQHDPVQTTKTSVHGAINMLGLAKRVKAKILQASTSEVYGDPERAPANRRLLGPCQSDRTALML